MEFQRFFGVSGRYPNFLNILPKNTMLFPWIMPNYPFLSKAQKESDTRIVYDIAFADGKSATAIWDQSLPFSAAVTSENGEESKKNINSPFFKILLDKIVVFFETGEVDFDRVETLTGMKIREYLLANEGEWTEVTPVV